MTSFSELWASLPDELYEATTAWQDFWSAAGGLKYKKPNISQVEIFVQPSSWPVWALVMTQGDCNLIGSYIVRGQVAEQFVRIVRTHVSLQLPNVGQRAMEDISDRFVKGFIEVSLPFVQGALMETDIENLCLLLASQLRALRENLIDTFKGSLKPKDLEAIKLKNSKLLLFGKKKASISSSSDSDSSRNGDSKNATSRLRSKHDMTPTLEARENLPETTENASPPRKGKGSRQRHRLQKRFRSEDGGNAQAQALLDPDGKNHRKAETLKVFDKTGEGTRNSRGLQMGRFELPPDRTPVRHPNQTPTATATATAIKNPAPAAATAIKSPAPAVGAPPKANVSANANDAKSPARVVTPVKFARRGPGRPKGSGGKKKK